MPDARSATTTSAPATTASPQIPMDDIGAHVREKFTRARWGRQITDVEMLNCLKQRRGEYWYGDAKMMAGQEIYLNITSIKCRAGESWINDVMYNNLDKPWTLEATARPEIPDSIKEMMVAKIKMELMAGNNVDPHEAATQMKRWAQDLLKEKADEAAAGMSTVIEDQLHEGGWKNAFREFISDLITYPIAIMKAPTFEFKKKLVWKDNLPIVENQMILAVKRVSPFDFWVSPNARDLDNCDTFERLAYTKEQVYEMRAMPGMKADNIDALLKQFPDGHRDEWLEDETRRQLESNSFSLPSTPDLMYEFIESYCQIPGYKLKKFGYKGLEELTSYWAVVVMCAGYTLRAVLNPDPLGRKPYRTTCYEKIPGALYGRSVPMLMRPQQEIVGSAGRALRRNMGLASGPIIEADNSRMDENMAIDEIKPLTVFFTDPDMSGGGRSAITIHQIPSNAGELLSVVEHEMKHADEVTGIPAYAYGTPTAGVGRTLGGLSLLMGNATKQLKAVIENIECDVIEHTVEAYFNYNMLYNPDDSIKCDAQVNAQGPSGLIQKDMMASKKIEVMQILTPWVQAGLVPKEGVMELLRDVVDTFGFDSKKIIPDQLPQGLVAQNGQPAPPGSQPATNAMPPQIATQPGTPGPKLDRRSQPMVGPQ